MLGIYSENREEYVITELACMGHSITVVPIFVNHYQQQVEEVIDQTMLKTLAVSTETLPTILKLKT